MTPLRKPVILVAALALLGAASLGVFIWAAYKNYEIGARASDTNTSGGSDPMALVWLLVSFAVLAAAIVGLLVMMTRHLAGARLRALYSNVPYDNNTAYEKIPPR